MYIYTNRFNHNQRYYDDDDINDDLDVPAAVALADDRGAAQGLRPAPAHASAFGRRVSESRGAMGTEKVWQN